MEFITLFGTPKKKEPTVFEKIKAAELVKMDQRAGIEHRPGHLIPFLSSPTPCP